MLIRLPILAVVLASLVGSPPTPGQATDGNSGISHEPEKHARSQGVPANPTITLIEKNCDSDQFKNDADCAPATDKESSVSISKLLPAHITIERTAPYDWLAYWAGIVLAGVGVVSMVFAVRTINMMKRQVDTFVSKERARIAVDIEPFNPTGNPTGNRRLRALYDKSHMPPARFETPHVDLRIANSGETNAFIRVAIFKACLKELNWNPRNETITSQVDLPKVMRPNADHFKHKSSIEISHVLKAEVDQETAQAIADGTLGIYLIGHIEFGDVFDNCWTVKVCRKWGGWWFNGKWEDTFSWYDYEPQASGEFPMNGEYQIKYPTVLRRILRRTFKKRTASAPS